MSDALREAAETILNAPSFARLMSLGGTMGAADLLARAYLAANPPDGEEPVTEAWLRALPGVEEEICGDGTLVFLWRDESGTLRLQLERNDERSWMASFYGHDNWPDDIHARIQVWQIAEALGIVLREEPAT